MTRDAGNAYQADLMRFVFAAALLAAVEVSVLVVLALP
jgi:hypothetical protein